MRAFRVGLLAAGMALWGLPAAAQTLFAWPDTTVDVSAYTTLEECEAAVRRSSLTTISSEALVTGIWRDTMPADSLEGRGLTPAPVAETAQRCMARFAAVDSVPLDNWKIVIPLYLQAGWDAKARALVDRRLATVRPDAEKELVEVTEALLEIYIGRSSRVPSRRLAVAQELVATLAPRISDRVKRLRIYSRVAMARPSDAAPDTAGMRRAVARMAALVDSLTEREQETLEDEYADLDLSSSANGGGIVDRYEAALDGLFGKRAQLDSLERSTASFIALRRGKWTRLTGMRPESYPVPIGERAPTLEGDIWLAPPGATRPRPAPGRVSLVVFLTPGKCMGVVRNENDMYGACARNLIPLRRLEERFPALEITVVAQTHGYFEYLKDSISPAREAELTKQWLESYGVHAPLLVSITDSWRLPAPDGRRINRLTANEINYSFGISGELWRGGNTVAYLVDENGIVVHAHQFHKTSVYVDFAPMIEVLLARRSVGE
jgi:hypothetical protein